MFHRHLPLPPRRRCSEGSAAAGIGDPDPNREPDRPSSEDGGNGLAIRTRPYYFRRCKRSIPTNIEFLPDEVLLEILLLLSAQDLYEKARLVCRRWNRIIHGYDFVRSHLHRSRPGLLLLLNDTDLIFVAATKKGGIEVSNLDYKKIRFPTISSCNGLVVGVEFTKKHFPYIVNPATNSSFILPRLGDRVWIGFFGIAYAAASMGYKVVATYRSDFDSILPECAILSIGVDQTWRHVAMDGISPRATVLSRTPKITAPGFMHWFDRCDVLTLNVETEVLTETPVPLSPQDYEDGPSLFFYLATGKYLTLLVYCLGCKYLWDLWEMKPETGEWRKLPRCIDLEAHKHKIHQFALKDQYILQPAGWVKYPEVLAFFFYGMSRSCIIYNLDRDEIDCIELPYSASWYHYVVHRNSLVWSS